MLKRHRILIVDDSPDNVDILQELLEDRFDLEIATSGEECLTKTADFLPDIILLDVMMPGIDGVEVCRQLRAAKGSSRLKIIFISAKVQLTDKLTGYAAGADDYIIKPFEKDFVLAKVLAYSRITNAEQEGERTRIEMRLIACAINKPLEAIKDSCRTMTASTSLNEQQINALINLVTNVDLLSFSLDKITSKE